MKKTFTQTNIKTGTFFLSTFCSFLCAVDEFLFTNQSKLCACNRHFDKEKKNYSEINSERTMPFSFPTSPSFSSSSSTSSLHSRLMDNFAVDWHNKALLNRIKNAKPKIDTNAKAIKRTPDNGRSGQRTQQQMEIEQQNKAMVQKFVEIYGRNTHN